MDIKTNKINFLIKEYEKLKDEQRTRIDFRDKMTFITLGSIGGVFSFVIQKPEYFTALLVLPFVCIVLGWTYLTNDDKISEIGTYCKEVLIPKLENLDIESSLSILPSWEDFHRNVIKRKEKKVIQLIIDLGLFCVSAIVSLVVFFCLGKNFSYPYIILASAEGLLVFYLAYQFIFHSPLR